MVEKSASIKTKRIAKTTEEITALLAKVGALMVRKGGASRPEICERLGIDDNEAKLRIWQTRNLAGFKVTFNRADERFYARAQSAKMRKTTAEADA